MRATIRSLENVSAHADYVEIINWLIKSKISPKKVFITHGEAESALMMKEHLIKQFNWTCEIPRQDQEFTLE